MTEKSIEIAIILKFLSRTRFIRIFFWLLKLMDLSCSLNRKHLFVLSGKNKQWNMVVNNAWCDDGFVDTKWVWEEDQLREKVLRVGAWKYGNMPPCYIVPNCNIDILTTWTHGQNKPISAKQKIISYYTWAYVYGLSIFCNNL